MKRLLIGAVVAAAALTGLAANEAQARFSPESIQAPSILEEAQCATRRVRTVRPNGRVIVRTIRQCGPGFGRRVDRCRTVRERIIRPNGRVIIRTVRRCR